MICHAYNLQCPTLLLLLYTYVLSTLIIIRWEIKKAAEGMAYVPPNPNDINDNGKLYIQLEWGIGVFDVPMIDSIAASADSKGALSFFESKFSATSSLSLASMRTSTEEEEQIPVLKPQYSLNLKLMTRGLDIDDIHVSSMQYFEDILYILFDNARVIRGYNLRTGDMVSDIKVPKVSSDGEFDKQWEGMFFERIGTTKRDNSDNSSIRGISSSSAIDKGSIVKLHMTLDTPPEVWTFKMTEDMKVSQTSAYDESMTGDVTSSVFQFPECAAAV